MRKPKFEIFGGQDGKFYFRLKAANGEPIMASKGFATKPDAMRGIASVMEHSPSESQFARRRSANYKFYFQLRTAGGRILGWSELYETKQGRDNGIKAVIRAAAHGRVFDLTF